MIGFPDFILDQNKLDEKYSGVRLLFRLVTHLNNVAMLLQLMD